MHAHTFAHTHSHTQRIELTSLGFYRLVPDFNPQEPHKGGWKKNSFCKIAQHVHVSVHTVSKIKVISKSSYSVI